MSRVGACRGSLRLLVAGVFVVGLGPRAAAIETGSGLEVAEPEIVRVVVDELTEGATEFGITKEGLEERVKVRVQLKGLEIGQSNVGYLLIKINVGGPVFAVTAGFYRNVLYSVSGGRREQATDLLGGTAAVWTREMFGTHGGQRSWLYSAVDEIVDLFLTEYRIANKPRLVVE